MLTEAQTRRVDVRLTGKHSLRKLLSRHLECEDRHTGMLADGGVASEIQTEGALPHARPRSDDHEVGALETAQEGVQVDVSGSDDAGRRVATFRGVEVALEDRPNVHEITERLSTTQRKQHRLGP